MKFKIVISALLLSLLFFNACKKKNDPTSQLPVVVIDSITNITLTSAEINGSVQFTGGLDITDKGICWATTQNPTVDNTKLSAGPGDGLIFLKITGLVKGTTYYVRTYAINSKGTAYSDQKTVKAGTVLDYDGNVYDVVTIKGRSWIGANLRVTHFNNGDPIPLVTSPTEWQKLTTPAYCYVNNSSGNTNSYGLLYNFYAAFDPRGIAPKGFKNVSYNIYFTMLNNTSDGGTIKTTNLWKAPNTGATNSTGFSAPGTGYRDSAGVYLYFNERSYFWDVDNPPSTFSYVAWLEYNSADFTANFNTLDKRSGLCVRCWK